MAVISDRALDHLRQVAEWPDLSGTRYEASEALGRGGMGTVYRARDRELDRDVALKVVSVPFAAEAAERLRREACILARLEHPGLVPVHDVGVLPDQRVFYTMRLVRGRRLDEHARHEPLPALLRAFERICEAVAFAHAHGVIHRDLKPENVMIGPFGEVLVLDWGVAKTLAGPEIAPQAPPTADPALETGTAHGTVLGTPGYMAPEQARGQIDRVDARADVYGLGAILYFLLVGCPPQPAADQRPEPPRRRNPELARALEAIALKALDPDPERRYADASTLADDVSRYLSGLPVAAYPEGPFDRLRRWAWRYRTPIGLVAAYLVVRLALLAVTGR